MDGLEGAVAALVTRLATALPAKTTELRERLDVDPETEGHLLPDVVTVAPYDRANLGVEEWPAVLVSGLETLAMTRLDIDGQKVTYQVRYQMRVFDWVRGDDSVTVALVRNRLTLALRELLLSQRAMDPLTVDEATLVESYSDLVADDEQATVGAAYIAVQVVVEEELIGDVADYGTVGTPVDLDTVVLPQHPAI